MKVLKSIGAVFTGLFVVFALTHLTDHILERENLMLIPFDKNPFWLMLVVTAYRLVYVAVGSFLTAYLAWGRPILHAMILGSIGCLLGIAGAIAMWDQGAHWYPVTLVILGWPAAFIGGKLVKS
ncbi:hypothetical protein EHQ58_15530 [Leptospira ognonensis]|uniref:Uncharacterized protein n=1 Tax=Leptospira ognonensis TaxID=2484945 RepID=A0A4V3JQS0_9LEPT|nr:hypothetical protein [Leptospira ognonensis]TGL56996.1 hypothetical protein EHQ58_15530 [Leptospira ognonensis]